MIQKLFILSTALFAFTAFANSDLVWSERLASKVTFDEAVQICESHNSRLPTIQELRESPSTVKDFYWSSTYMSGGTEMVWIFSGFDPHGKIAMRLEYKGIAVSCVALP
jgi:hypothetical protein